MHGVRREPRRPPVPAGHARRVERVLAHHLEQPGPAVSLDPAAHRADRSREEDHRCLDHVRPVEVPVERRVAEDGLHHRLDPQARAAVAPDERAAGARVDRYRDEVAPELVDEERRMVTVGGDDPEHVAPAEAPALAEDPLDAAVVRRAVEPDALEAVVGPAGAEARERARRLADVALGVAAPEREELHQLPRVVLVRRLLGGVGERQEELHRRVARDSLEQRPEAAERPLAQHAVLREHLRRLLPARGEVVVPEEGHLLHERALSADHPVEPPEDVVTPLVQRVERLAVDARRRADEVGPAATAQDEAERRVPARPRPSASLLRRRAETGAPEEASDVLLGPAGGHRRVRFGSALRGARLSVVALRSGVPRHGETAAGQQ